ncbi:MAG TPA: CDP-diacylglycerol--glycerol-3-phosphate 3-phosphatidyltransferase [Lachnospiraceae bacterium]|nr:CDP-diacylglycerol--glycerol-3-phosphate 3-phosphatidyltransferase [Lachnospiraceae bacterium]
MNLPNKLTLLRMILIPFFVFFLLTEYAGNYSEYIALGIFVVASLTDFLDGYIARKYELVTNFGKFMDPLADKLLVSSAMICFVELGRMPAWIVIVIISREFIISGFRLIAVDNRVVIAASWWGKFKTAFQIIMVILMILNLEILTLLTTVVMWLALALTVISLIDYLVKNKEVMKEQH